MANLSGLVQELQIKLKEKEARIKKLEEQFAAIGVKPEVAEAPKKEDPAVRKLLDDLQAQVTRLHGTVTAREGEIDRLKAAHEAELQKLRDAAKPLAGDEASRELRAQLSALGDFIKDLQGKLKIKDEKIAALQKDLEETKKPRVQTSDRWWY